MLAELAAFNAGFAVVKQVVANGRDLSDAMGAIAKMIGAKEDLQRRGEKKKKSFMSVIGGKAEDDFEEFLALEKIKVAEKELASMMKLYGRPGLYDDWVRHQAMARKKRREEDIAAKKEKEKLWEYVAGGLVFIFLLVGSVSLIFLVKYLRDGSL